MPAFSAIALDHLVEPGASKPSDGSDPHSVPSRSVIKHLPPSSKHGKRSSSSTQERKVPHPQVSPALYATPAPTPLPDAPSSFPPSPYIIDHKRRGPRLQKSSSANNVSAEQGILNEEKVSDDADKAETKPSYSNEDSSIEELHANGDRDYIAGSINREVENSDGKHVRMKKGVGSSDSLNLSVEKNGSQKLVAMHPGRENGESEDFFDPQESTGYASNTDGEDNGGQGRAAKIGTPMGEFFDASEELSSEGPQTSFRDIETELREIRLAMLMERERRKQSQKTLDEMRCQWQRIRQQLAPVGLMLSADLTIDEGTDPAEELCQQVYLARYVSESIGRGIAKAEAEEEIEAQVEAKNFEIARLLDRLHYYETVNQEMSQRNQEAVEMARRQRHGRSKKQMRVWGSIAAVVTLGSAAALAWSYLPAKSSSSQAPERGDATK